MWTKNHAAERGQLFLLYVKEAFFSSSDPNYARVHCLLLALLPLSHTHIAAPTLEVFATTTSCNKKPSGDTFSLSRSLRYNVAAAITFQLRSPILGFGRENNKILGEEILREKAPPRGKNAVAAERCQKWVPSPSQSQTSSRHAT